jgi:hypothetical protein
MTWASTLSKVNGAITKAPKAWAAVNAELGTSAAALFAGASLSTFLQITAAKLVEALIAAASAIEPQLATLGSSETAARVAWAVDLAAVNALVADVDGGSSTGATVQELRSRIDLSLATAGSLGPGKATLVRALRVPVEPSLDVAFRNALQAVKFFFL